MAMPAAWTSLHAATRLVVPHRSVVLPPSRRAKVAKKLGNGFDAGDEQMVSCSRAGNVQKMPFGVVDLLKVRVIGHGFNPCL